MADDLIFLNIDPVYNIALYAVDELNEQRRLAVTNIQQCRLNSNGSGIQSDDEVHDNRYRFGGNMGGKMRASAFGRTASSTMRMVMLHAVGIADSLRHCSRMGKFSGPRNWAAIGEVEVLYPINGEMFHLANVADSSRYCTKYDQLNPPSSIREKVWNAAIGNQVSFNSMMLIFRNNFQEVIEITTTAHATKSPEGMREDEIDSYVNVLCIRREISDGVDGPQLTRMKNSFGDRDRDLDDDYVGQLAKNDNDTDDVWHQRLNDTLANLAI